MKTLNITLTIKANDYNVADILGQGALIELVKTIGINSGSYIASCSGNTEYAADGVYEVSATVELDGNGDVTEIIKEMQLTWNANPNIMSSSIFVTEEQKPEPVQKEKEPETYVCYECGQVMVKGYEHTINPGTEEEYYLCNACFEREVDNDNVITCQCCDEYVNANDLVRNPVTGNNDLCPCCGNKIEY